MVQLVWRWTGLKMGGGGGAEDEPARFVVGLKELVEEPGYEDKGKGCLNCSIIPHKATPTMKINNGKE